MIRGITIELSVKKEVGKDGFGRPVYEEAYEPVDNVLVAPASSDDIVNNLNLEGKKVVYTLAIPKGDTHTWENQTVKFFNEKWTVCTAPMEGIEELVPLQWNKKVMVERYE